MSYIQDTKVSQQSPCIIDNSTQGNNALLSFSTLSGFHTYCLSVKLSIQLALEPLWSETVSVSVLGGCSDVTMSKEMEI